MFMNHTRRFKFNQAVSRFTAKPFSRARSIVKDYS
jgi:hypothetical protein